MKPTLLPARCWEGRREEERREGNEAEVDKKWPSPMPEGRELLCGGVRDRAWMMDGTPAVFSPRPGRPAVEFFLARKALQGVGVCFRERAVLWERSRWGSPVQAGPTEVGGTRCVPQVLPGRQRGSGSRTPAAGWGGLGTLGAGGNGSCSRCALRVKLRRAAGCFAWGRFSAEAAGFIPGVTLGSSIPSDGRTRGGGRFAQLFWSAPGPTNEGW